jgi:hypothetical protein
MKNRNNMLIISSRHWKSAEAVSRALFGILDANWGKDKEIRVSERLRQVHIDIEGWEMWDCG